MPYLTNLAKVARKAGLDVVEVPGWQTRGHGVMGSIQTITCHHTANQGAKGDAPSLNTVKNGRPGLEGPLAHFVLGKSGTVYVVAAGLCYHAGVSHLNRQTNPHAIGIEAEAIGTPGAPGDWPAAQMAAYARLCRALAVAYSVPLAHVQGHYETAAPAGRKTDPTFSMPAFRTQVALGTLTTKADDDVAFSDKHKVTAADVAAWGPGSKYREGDEVSYDELVRFPPAVERLRRETADQLDRIEKLLKSK